MAAYLIPYENPEILYGEHPNLEWYEYLFQQMGPKRAEFVANRLTIVTFNYDRSLEYFLFTSVRHSFGRPDPEVAELIRAIPFVHVYGQLGKPDFLHKDGRSFTPDVTTEAVDKCVSELRIVSEVPGSSPELEEARVLVANADVVCFLGFAYHPENVRRLEIREKFHGESLLGSAYRLGPDEQQRVREMFHGGPREISLGGANADVLGFLREFPVFR